MHVAIERLLELALSLPVCAHQQPTTLALLDIGARDVTLSLHVPLNEWKLALGHQVTERPEQRIATWETAFRRYLADHIRLVRTLVGLDQVHIRIPASLAGRGVVTVVLTVDGKAANTVTITIR
ncbi:MAG: hypothetical protein JNK87_31745 [Bryobacterales bacterium]|nr:hypothetical protein [Bryobacterales bacterium]